MANKHQEGRQKELAVRGVPDDTLITSDNYNLIITQESLIAISNDISKILKRKLSSAEVSEVIAFARKTNATCYYRMLYRAAQQKMAKDFIERKRMLRNVLTEEGDTANLSRASEYTDRATVTEYEKEEIFQYTPSENQYKFTAHADRRGNAVIDRDRVAGERSSPDSILPVHGLTREMVDKELYLTMRTIQSMVNPDSIDRALTRIQISTAQYNSTNLPHQLIQFDSRNRVPTTSTNIQYQWILHTAANPGQIGAVHIRDTLQQVIQIKLFPFWAPINATTVNIYDKIRMLIHEYESQSSRVTEWNDTTMSVPTTTAYHFELEVTKTTIDMMYLVPVENIFRFRKPMAKNLDTFTISFTTPFQQEVFDADAGVFTITFANPTLFTITSPAAFNLNTGDLIYVYNSHSVSSAINNEINRATGHVITKLSSTQFTIAVDSSTLIGSETGINVYYGSKRLFFHIEFTCLEQ